ncbi:molybdopterin-dependent oxidoreductase [Variovorax sp. HJSM1_2]|uniref:molybdopterin-dependent oxidoreductase n=1 Tax=Variovorax sp. HJSM1_2 TaxID=3366263 RepID=UPI003BBB1C2D
MTPGLDHHRRRLSLQAVCCAALCMLACPTWAQTAPTGKVVLTIKGNVAKPNAGPDAQFDIHMLQGLRQVSHSVDTPWYSRKVTFSGPLMRDVLAAAGATGQNIKAVAINDYAVNIPFSDATRYEVILALQMNGKAMSPRDKGPIFVVYPYGQFSAAEVKLYHDRSVWQLDTLEVK